MLRFRFFYFLLLFSFVTLKSECVQITGVGGACVDYVVSVDESFLHYLSIKKGTGLFCDWKQFSEIFQLASSQEKPLIATGGTTANMIKGIAHLGLPCALVSKVGKDPMGTWFCKIFSSLGIQCQFISAISPTTQVLCLITPDGERTFCVFRGSDEELCIEDLKNLDFSQSKHFHFEGYHLQNGFFVEDALFLAKEKERTVSFDLSDARLTQNCKERIISKCLPYIDILFSNEEEAYALTSLPPEQACLELSKKCLIAIVKVGEKGCYVGFKDTVFHSPSFPADVVDTTGAGDLFASGFLYGYLSGASLEECARFGNLLGAAVVQEKGAEISSYKWEMIKKELTVD